MPSHANRSLSTILHCRKLLVTICAMLLTLIRVITLFTVGSFGLSDMDFQGKFGMPEGKLGGRNSHEADESHFAQFPDKDVNAGQQVAAVVRERHEPDVSDLPGLRVQQHSLQQACQAPECEHCGYDRHKTAGMPIHSSVATTSLLWGPLTRNDMSSTKKCPKPRHVRLHMSACLHSKGPMQGQQHSFSSDA